jgi:hypothetical protein
MKTLCLLAVAMLSTVVCQAQYAPLPQPPQYFAPHGLQSLANTNVPVNYVIKVLMKDPKGNEDSLQVTTIDGSFELDTILKNSVKTNSAVPTTLRLTGTLTPIDDKKALVKFFLGHGIAYVSSSYNNGAPPSYGQMSVGLNSTFVVTYGKSLLVQSDDSGEVSVLVTREKD